MSDISEQPVSNTTEQETTKWYVLRVISGKERKIKEYLDKEIKINGWEKAIVQVLCPLEKVFKVQSGKKFYAKKSCFPAISCWKP